MSKQLAGIQGILGNYVTSQTHAPPSPAAKQTEPKPIPDQNRGQRKPKSRKSARLGRPPGKSTETSPRKEKATLRIDAELMSDYRDWSWDQRCQLGELVERALADYRRRHR